MEEDAIDYVRQVLEGLKYMHSKNIVHLDLKVELYIFYTFLVCKYLGNESSIFMHRLFSTKSTLVYCMTIVSSTSKVQSAVCFWYFHSSYQFCWDNVCVSCQKINLRRTLYLVVTKI